MIQSSVAVPALNPVRALGQAALSQLHPRMLALLIGPFLLAGFVWLIAAWLLWTPITGWLRAVVVEGWIGGLFGWQPTSGGWADWIAPIIAALLIAPLIFTTALVVVGIFAMPLVLRFVGARHYPDIERRADALGARSLVLGAWNGLSSFAVFAVGYVLTMPLWLIPPLIVVVPWLWWSWLTARVMRFDSLSDHATPAERAELIARERRRYMGLGMAVSLLNLVPPLFLVTPVYGALVFAHHSLAALRALRAAGPVIQSRHGVQLSGG